MALKDKKSWLLVVKYTYKGVFSTTEHSTCHELFLFVCFWNLIIHNVSRYMITPKKCTYNYLGNTNIEIQSAIIEICDWSFQQLNHSLYFSFFSKRCQALKKPSIFIGRGSSSTLEFPAGDLLIRCS